MVAASINSEDNAPCISDGSCISAILYARIYDLDNNGAWVGEHKHNRNLFRFLFAFQFYEHPSFSHPHFDLCALLLTGYLSKGEKRNHHTNSRMNHKLQWLREKDVINNMLNSLTEARNYHWSRTESFYLMPCTIILGLILNKCFLYITLHMLVTDILTQNNKSFKHTLETYRPKQKP